MTKKDQQYQRILPSGCKVVSDAAFNWQSHFAALGRQAQKKCLKQYYNTLPVPGETPIDQVRFLALDLETTGMDAADSAIVSMGFVPFDIHRIYCRKARHILVKPELPLSEKSATIHSITHSRLSTAGGFNFHLNDLLDAIKQRVVVVHYHEMERSFLARTVERLYNDILEFPLIDTMVIESKISSARPRSWVKRLFAKQEKISLRLDACRKRYGLPRYQPHHALTDAIAAAELLMAQLQTHYPYKTPVSKLWL